MDGGGGNTGGSDAQRPGKRGHARTQSMQSASSVDYDALDAEDAASSRNTRTTQEKQRLLGRYLANVNELVQDLEESGPLSTLVS